MILCIHNVLRPQVQTTLLVYWRHHKVHKIQIRGLHCRFEDEDYKNN